MLLILTCTFVIIRYARAGVQAFLKAASSSIGGDAASHDAWQPPLTADLLLQPHLGLFPFPSYFSALHEFLAAFYHSGRKSALFIHGNYESLGHVSLGHILAIPETEERSSTF